MTSKDKKFSKSLWLWNVDAFVLSDVRNCAVAIDRFIDFFGRLDFGLCETTSIFGTNLCIGFFDGAESIGDVVFFYNFDIFGRV